MYMRGRYSLGVVLLLTVVLTSCSTPREAIRIRSPWDTLTGHFVGVKKVSGYLHDILRRGETGHWPFPRLSFIGQTNRPISNAARDTVRLTDGDIYVLYGVIPAHTYVSIRNHLFRNTDIDESTRDKILQLLEEGRPDLSVADSIDTDSIRYMISRLTDEEVVLFQVSARDALDDLYEFNSIPHTFESKDISLALLVRDKAALHRLVPREYWLAK
jgi:hypothetical protein